MERSGYESQNGQGAGADGGIGDIGVDVVLRHEIALAKKDRGDYIYED